VRTVRALIALAVVAVGLGCGNSTGSPGVATLDVSLNPISLVPMDSVQISVTPLDGAGHLVVGVSVTFSSTDTTVVTVSVAGVVRSQGPAGSATVTVSGGGVVTLVPVTVFAPLPLSGGPLGIAVSGNVAYVSRDGAAKLQHLNLVNSQFTDSVSVGSVPCYLVFNAAGTKAYVANQFSHSVSVIDVATDTQTRAIPVTGDPLPVAISGDGNTLFVTTNANRLYKIALANDSVVDSLALPATSHHLLMHPNDTLLYVATRDAGTVLEVNWRAMTVARTFTLGGRTQGMAISLDRQELYVADEGGAKLHIVTLATGNSPTPITLAGGGEGLALSADGTRLYVGLVFDGKVQVINRAARTIVQTMTTGGVPREIAVDATRSRVLVANESGWVNVLR